MNKFLDDEIVKKIYKNKIKNDTPCYVYDLGEIKNNVNNITNYMPNNFSLYYAIKANPNKEVLKFIKSLNRVSGFEIASAGELIKALEFCTSKEIIFTGPGKTVEELEKDILNNIRLINIESIGEAIRINQIAEKNDIAKVDVLIRVNMDYKIEDAAENMGGLSTKMGIDESKYMDSLKYIKKLSHLNIKGIHVFSASGILNYKASVDYARYVFEMVKKMENLGERIDIIDLGGGLGVDYVIEGGQTMNPSTEDILNAVDKVNADTVFVLPNNKNIILAAQQAASIVEDKKIVVIPSKTVPQGITAMFNYEIARSAEENEQAMSEGMSNVKSGEVTYAVRDTSIDGHEIHCNDIMGLGDTGLLAVSHDVKSTVMQMLGAMVDDESELISIYYGSDVNENDADAMVEAVSAEYPGLDVELQRGGQPIYYYIISVE